MPTKVYLIPRVYQSGSRYYAKNYYSHYKQAWKYTRISKKEATRRVKISESLGIDKKHAAVVEAEVSPRILYVEDFYVKKPLVDYAEKIDEIGSFSDEEKNHVKAHIKKRLAKNASSNA